MWKETNAGIMTSFCKKKELQTVNPSFAPHAELLKMDHKSKCKIIKLLEEFIENLCNHIP